MTLLILVCAYVWAELHQYQTEEYKFLKEWIQYVLATAESGVYFGLLD